MLNHNRKITYGRAWGIRKPRAARPTTAPLWGKHAEIRRRLERKANTQH